MSIKGSDTVSIVERGTRITPRTCLWPLAGSLVVTFALSIGLTFRSDHHCYAGTCGEWLFPLQARVHVVIWYAWLSLSTTFLAIRAFHPEMQRFLAQHLTSRKLPVLRKHLSLGGCFMTCWVISLYGVVVAVWWIRLRDYFTARNEAAGIFNGSGRLAAIALTGHICDITMGMVLLPISRHSALASFFKISVSTTLTNHVVTAYTLFLLVMIHGILYVAWIPVFNGLSESLRMVIPVLNPTYLYHETWPGNQSALGVWRASLIFTGSAAALIMVALAVTTLPAIRSKNFNLFYFTHLLSILMVVIICLHASTMFYCTAPGLCMWLLDWGMRLYELRKTLDGSISTLGAGWFCVTLPLPRSRLTGCSCRSPLAHFYIHHAGSSIRELHPFTTITHLASMQHTMHPSASRDDFPIQFLFRKQGKITKTTAAEIEQAIAPRSWYRRMLRGKQQRVNSIQWTAKLAALVEKDIDRTETTLSSPIDHWSDIELAPSQTSVSVSLRLEGPYFTSADPHRYDTVICMVAGTGISGALAIASAFNSAAEPSDISLKDDDAPSERRWKRCIILWSVKEADDIALSFLEPRAKGLMVTKFLTGSGRKRVDLKAEIAKLLVVGDRTWVYISGPSAYIGAGKAACKIAAATDGVSLDFYAASWEP